MSRAIEQEDVELGGEFLHCLWLLDRPMTPAQREMVQHGPDLTTSFGTRSVRPFIESYIQRGV